MKSTIEMMQEKVDYLLTHNKNYTKKQWYELLELEEMVKSLKQEDEEFFGVVRWCNEDIANAIETQGYEPTEENIAKVGNKLEHHSFVDCMIEAGWDFIYNIVDYELMEE